MQILDTKDEDFITALIEDNKIDVIRECICIGRYDLLEKREGLNYISDEKLNELIDSDLLNEVIDKYSYNDRFIEFMISRLPESKENIKLMLEKNIQYFYPKHFEKILEYRDIRKIIKDNIDNLNNESVLFLVDNRVIDTKSPEHVCLIMENKMYGKSVFNKNMRDITMIAFYRQLSSEELDYVINKIMGYDSELEKQGNMLNLAQCQELPVNILKDILEHWVYKSTSMLFKNIVKYQNLDEVLDYILENVDLDETALNCIINNPKTSTRILAKMYDICPELVIKNSPSNLPVLDCHIHYNGVI